MALTNIPGYGAYVARRQMNEQAPLGQLQQATQAMNLAALLRKRDEEAALDTALAEGKGDPEQAIQIALKTGNVQAAQQLAPIARMAAERRQADETKRGLAALLTPEQPAETGVAVGAVTGQPAPSSPGAVAPQGVNKAARIAHLNKLAVLYANNPALQTRIQAEITKLEEVPKPEKAPELSPLGKLYRERNKYPAGSPEYKVYDQAITKFQPGGVQVHVSPNAPLIPGKPAQNKVDEGLLDTGARLQGLSAIERQFKPEYQQVGTRVSASWSSIKEKAGLGLDEGDKQFLTEFSQYKRNSIDALNQYIKSVTGAAMTNAEAERIMRGLPNPGTGLFDGDSPTEFKAKLDDALKQSRMAEARLVYIKRNGMSIGDVSLDRMPRIMNERGAELEKLLKQKNAQLSDADVRKLVKRNLSQEFGLVE